MMSQNMTTTQNEVNNILTMLNDGERKMEISTQGNIVMVLGNTGAGKSTFVQFLLGNNDEMLSSELIAGTNEFIIQDKSGRISVSSTINSKTDIPELIVDELTNTAYYDNPGFSDTRNPEHEIMQTYLIRKVIQSAKKIKLIFVVNHSSVRRGVDRLDFMLLLRHATSLIKDLDKYRNSIGLIVSKVENQYALSEEKLVLVSDEAITNGIVGFIEKVKHDLYGRLKSANWRNEKDFHNNAIKFINTLTKDNICLFRRPNKSGPVSKIAVMQSGKKRMRTMIDSNLTFAPMIPNNFGFTISDKAKNYVYELVFEIRKTIDEELENLAVNIKRHYEVTERNTRDLDQLATIFKVAADTFNYIANRNWTPREFVKQIMKTSRKMSLKIPSTNFNHILNYDKYLEFLNAVSAKEDVVRSVLWSTKAHQLLKYNQDSLEWYTFLQNLYSELSQSKVQQHKILRYPGSNTVKQIYDIAYLKKLNLPGMKLNTINVDNIDLNETKRKILQSIVEATIEKPLQFSKIGQKIIVQGHHVVLSHITDKLMSCQFCDIYIFAIDTIFIDIDVNKKGHEGSVSMIAFKWEVVGNIKTISLNGQDGAARLKAKNAYKTRERGSQGLPGFPGKPAGRFFGIAKQFIGGGKLVVEAIGGKGGPGQDGGDGGPGYSEDKYNGFQKGVCWTLFLFGCPVVNDISGKNVYPSGSGGYGGVGGIGGQGGHVKIHIFSGNENQIIISTKDGETGEAGKDGQGGEPNSITRPEASSGDFGFANLLSNPMEFGSIINRYKEFIRLDPFRKSRSAYFQNFIEKLEEDKDVSMLYVALDFIEELHNLENMELSEAESYHHLLTNIERFALSHQLSQDSKLVLNYLYTATLSCLYRINKRKENFMILDITDYLIIVVDEIRKFRKSGYERNLNMYHDEFIQHINEKISEAQKLIENDITPKIETILGEVGSGIESLLIQMDRSNARERLEIEQLNEQEDRLESDLILMLFSEGVKLAARFLGFLGPIVDEVSELIQITASVVEPLILTDSRQPKPISTFLMSGELPKLLQQFSNIITNKQNKMKLQLNDVEEALLSASTNDTTLKGLRNVVADAQLRLDGELNKGVHSESASEMKRIGDKLNNAMSQAKQSLEATNSKLLPIVSYAQNIIAVGQASLDIYAQLRNEKQKINVVGDTIQQMYQRLDELIAFENDILNIITTSTTRLRSNVNKLTDRSNNMSNELLQIHEWDIQVSLRQLKQQFQTMTQLVKVDNNLTECLDKLQSGMSVAIAILDRIQSNKEQAKLIAYLRNINSDGGEVAMPGNYVLKKSVDDLQHRINANLVMVEYEIVINGVKQYVFPFAHYFLNGCILPQNLAIQNRTDAIANMVAEKLETLTAKLERSKVTINRYDKHIHRNIEFRDSQPFYAWRSYAHQESIKKLLDGQEVTLQADVLKGVKQNAVKFKQIGVRFKILEGDEKVQSDFDQQLRHFDVRMTHGGLSHYRCDNKFYTINGDNQTLSYSLDRNGNPIRTNVVYDKIREHDYMLSPFTSWKFSLVRIKAGVGNLAKFRNNAIDLYLEGQGQFVSNVADICDDDLKHYYHIDESISEMNDVDLLKQNFEDMLIADGGRQQLPKTRKRRNAVEDSIPSSAGSNHKSSFIGNIVNWFARPVRHITNWLPTSKEHHQFGIELKLNMDQAHFDANRFATGKLLTENDTTTHSSMTFTNTDIQHNLLFLNLLTHRKFHTKFTTGNEIFSFPNDEISNRMAYNAYADNY